MTSRYDENSYNTSLDPSFEKRLEAVKRYYAGLFCSLSCFILYPSVDAC